jgi:hypothetical protein
VITFSELDYSEEERLSIVQFNKFDEAKPMEQDKIMSIIYISLPAVSISIISINNKRPVELNLITLFDVELASSNQNDTKSF